MRYRVAEVIFKGNHAKRYSFFVQDYCDCNEESIEAACCHVGDWCLCDTSTGLSVGEVVAIREFADRPKECYRFILWFLSKNETRFQIDKYHKDRVKQLIEAEKKAGQEEDDLDFLKDL